MTGASRTEAVTDLNLDPIGGAVLEQSDSEWLIRCDGQTIALGIDASEEQIVSQLSECLESVAAGCRRCVLALATSECFFVNFDLPASINPKDRTGVIFELERFLPLDAESMTADFSGSDSATRVAAVAVETQRHRDLVRRLEEAEIEVAAIIPSTFLIARAVCRWRGSHSMFDLLLFRKESAELLTVGPGGVCQWRRFLDPDNELPVHLSSFGDRDERAESLVVVGRNELPFEFDRPIQWCSQRIEELQQAGAASAMTGRWGRWPDLRRDSLAPPDPLYAVARPLRWLSIAAVICCLVVAVAASFRVHRIAEQSEAVQQQQRAAFAEAFPSRRVPVMLMRTVRNEHRRMLGSRGHGDDLEIPVAATDVLRDLLRGLARARLDNEIPFRLIDVDIIDGECSFTVRTKNSVQIGAIAKSLESVGFEVAPPATDQIEPTSDEPLVTYQSRIVAQWQPAQWQPAQWQPAQWQPAQWQPSEEAIR